MVLKIMKHYPHNIQNALENMLEFSFLKNVVSEF